MLNIAIIGCGPAGLSAAIFLHDLGHSVTLYERFDKAHPVGSGLMLQPTGLEVLAHLGLRDPIEQLGQKIDGMLGKVAPDGKVVLDINYRVLSPELYGVAIHRASLFHVLFDAVTKRSIDLITNCEISGTQETKNRIAVIAANGESVPGEYDFIVDASGSQSALLRYATRKPRRRALHYGALWGTVKYNPDTFDQHLLEQRYKAANIMVGVLPCGRLPDDDASIATFFWSLRDDAYAATVSAGIESWKRDVLQYWPAVKPLLDQFSSFDQLAHARYSHHTLPVPYGNKIVFIGDAAHSTSPQLGQGANMALLDSYALAKAVEQTDSVHNTFSLYAKMRKTHVRLFQTASLSLTPFYQSDSRLMPWLRDTFFEPVSKIPFADKMVTSLGAGLLTKPNNAIDRHSSPWKRT